jgi:hypothetical protein
MEVYVFSIHEQCFGIIGSVVLVGSEITYQYYQLQIDF